jgi:hypothetical protein
MFLAALPSTLIGEEMYLGVSADRTFHYAVWPTDERQELKANIRVLKVSGGFQ